jgi:mono/diheme cytochrome c family protein
MSRTMSTKAALVVTALVLAVGGSVSQMQATDTVKKGVYTSEQADRGKLVYEKKCLECHGSMDSPTPAMAPLLNDYGFQVAWKDRSVGQFFSRIRETMPQNQPNTLSPEEVAEIIAFVLSANQMPTGAEALPTDVELLRQIKLDALP